MLSRCRLALADCGERFWTAVMQDPEYASELSMKKGKREPAIPHSVKGTNQPFVVETPRDLMSGCTGNL